MSWLARPGAGQGGDCGRGRDRQAESNGYPANCTISPVAFDLEKITNETWILRR
jgi:hypothetical protein